MRTERARPDGINELARVGGSGASIDNQVGLLLSWGTSPREHLSCRVRIVHWPNVNAVHGLSDGQASISASALQQ